MKFKGVLAENRQDGLLLNTTDYLCHLFNLFFRQYDFLCVVNKWLVMGELIGLKAAKIFTRCRYKCRLKTVELYHEIL